MRQKKEELMITHRKPDISYPCEWEYKVIGTDQKILQKLIREACHPEKPVIALSNVSTKGTYYSLNATLLVESEQKRLSIFKKLQENPHVKMVI